jgi:hypothetical protein
VFFSRFSIAKIFFLHDGYFLEWIHTYIHTYTHMHICIISQNALNPKSNFIFKRVYIVWIFSNEWNDFPNLLCTLNFKMINKIFNKLVEALSLLTNTNVYKELSQIVNYLCNLLDFKMQFHYNIYHRSICQRTSQN